jgi:hypothetical protein
MHKDVQHASGNPPAGLKPDFAQKLTANRHSKQGNPDYFIVNRQGLCRGEKINGFPEKWGQDALFPWNANILNVPVPAVKGRKEFEGLIAIM